MKRIIRSLAVTCLSAAAYGQYTVEFNVDIGTNFGTPPAGYDGGDVQSGVWNSYAAAPGTAPLVDRLGGASGVSLSITGTTRLAFDNAGTSGSDQELMDDAARALGTQALTVHGLPPGVYVVVTYAWAPDSAAAMSEVVVPTGEDPPQTVGGGWAGHGLGTTFAAHHVNHFGGVLNIYVHPVGPNGVSTINGLQIQTLESGQLEFCTQFDRSLAACPCSNPGAVDSGCDNAQGTGGVRLWLTDYDPPGLNAQFTATGFPPAATPTAIVIRAEDLRRAPVSFGDGAFCVGLQGFSRLSATAASGGRSVHDIGHGAGSGFYYYQVWYRNLPVSYCVTTQPHAGAFNLSNGRALGW